jgi:hypothetical protein
MPTYSKPSIIPTLKRQVVGSPSDHAVTDVSRAALERQSKSLHCHFAVTSVTQSSPATLPYC